MDFQDISTGRSPRRELQGPRPTPLRINKDSHKIKKPPLAPAPQPPPRQPIIIYTVSPKVIHTTPDDFMNLVQRLTGSSSSSSSSSLSDMTSSNHPFNSGGGMISPAARYATIEKARPPMGKKQVQPIGDDISHVGGLEMVNHGVERGSMCQGILSPGPASLSPIPSSFFSPPSLDPNMVNFLHELSPAFQNRNVMDQYGGFILPSPTNFVSPYTPPIDLFNYFLD
ncbi:hypothetical protein TanjilG_14080 [Lupinus angustifolius]|uniref:VQ domain-containing protein n=1 Tax=Lupinus angustifolius TaxID=3871 RepID=A0A1J7H8C9_LUPAN|nr:PREDICTED: protein MKS1 [Lupinus angustifolius]OIV97980.1 hypothetical protein TanjilG_14080 [Lupinus angustifolius]